MPEVYQCRFPLETATPETFLEQLLKQGAQSRAPIVVNDQHGRVSGVITRETLLTALVSA